MKIMDLGKQQIYELLQRVIVLTNYYALGFEELIKESTASPEDIAELSLHLHETFGKREAQGLLKMGLITGEGLDAVEEALAFSHWAVLEDLRINRPNSETLFFGVVDCSYKKFVKKRKRRLDCSESGLELRKSYIKVIEPRAAVCPRPLSGNADHEQYSCLWQVTCP